MKRLYFIVAAVVLGIAGVILSFLIIPSDSEVALIKFKDKQYEQALKLYETQYQQGNLNLDVVMHLTGVYLQFGEIDKAIKVMEDFVTKNPDHLSARRELGSLYQYGQRLDDYARNLEEINRIEQSTANLQELSDMYESNEEYEKQVPVVVKLIESDEKQSPQSMSNAARMLASEKKYDQAIEVLRKKQVDALAAAQNPDHKINYDDQYDDVELLVRLLIEVGRKDEAVAEAKKYRDTNPPLGQVASLTNIINYLVGVNEAYDFILPYENRVKENQSLLSEYVLILIRRNEHDKAYALLKPMFDAEQLPMDLYDDMLFLAVERGDKDTTSGLLGMIDFAALSEETSIGLVELALVNDVPELIKVIDLEANKSQNIAQTKPRLVAALALAQKRDNAKAKLDALPYEKLDFGQRAQLARICAQVANNGCVERFEASLPPVTELTEAETVGTGEILLSARHYKSGREYLKPVKDTYKTEKFQQLWVRFAAANGDIETVNAWLEANPNSADKLMLTDLYFSTINTGHYKLAVSLAERIIQLENTPDTRGYLVQAYIKNNQLAKAVEVLRDHRDESQQDADNYLYALIKLVKQDGSYAKELSDYAQAQLASGKVSYKQRLALIYALIDAGQGHIAMPHVRTLALNEGGDWVALYGEHNIKQGNVDEVVKFWHEVAQKPHANKKVLSQIAYSLLEHGYGNHAIDLFEQMAANEPASSPLVQQMVFLWGPNLTIEQMQWLNSRAQAAQDPKEKEQWMRYAVNGSNAKSLMQFVRLEPTSLEYKVVEEPYLSAVNLTDHQDYLQSYLAHRVEYTNDPTELKRYADLATGYSVNSEAVRAYEKILQQQPENGDALLYLGIQAHGRGNYTVSRDMLQHYIALLESGQVKRNTDSYQAYFYTAEILRRDRKKDEMQRYYSQAAIMIQEQPKPTTQARSQLAQSLAYSGDQAGARQEFERLLQQYPDDGLLRADYANMLIESKDYDAAGQVMSGYAGPVFERGDLQPLVIRNAAIQTWELIGYDQQLVVVFDPKVKNPGWLTDAQIKNYPWLSYSGDGYNRATLVAMPAYRMQVSAGTDGSLIVTPIPVISEQEIEVGEALNRRYVLLDARSKLETGQGYAARESLHELLANYPDNPEVLGFTANAENYLRNWPRALKLLEKAQAQQPDNEDVAKLMRDINRRNAPNLFIDEEWRMLGDNDEFITTVGGNFMVDYEWELGLVLQHDELDTQTIRRSNGELGQFDIDKQRGELYMAHYWEDGEKLKGSLFANNDTLGGGLYFNWVNPIGYTGLAAEYHKPYWEFVESVADDVTRDRLEINHAITLKGDIAISAQAGVNNYNLDVQDDIMQSGFFGVQVAVPIVQDPYYLAVGYGVDGEYQIDEDLRTDAAGIRFQSLPLKSREIHFLSLIGSYNFTEDTIGDATVGYAYDRLGEHGPAAEVRMTHFLTERLSVEGRASYGLSSSETDDEVKRLGINLKYRH